MESSSSSRYPCDVCTEEVVDFGAHAVACNSCDRWIHKSCIGMLTAEYEELAGSSILPWFCPDCGTPNHSSVIYEIPLSDITAKVVLPFQVRMMKVVHHLQGPAHTPHTALPV